MWKFTKCYSYRVLIIPSHAAINHFDNHQLRQIKCSVISVVAKETVNVRWKRITSPSFSDRHGKPFTGKQYKKRSNDLLKFSRHLLRLTVAIFTGHAPVRGHLYTMGLFDGDPTCRFCRKETETVQRIICCCQALAHQRYVFGNLSNQKI
jgi:hypothetical protein